ncbi:MAG: arylsulfatase [Verrucomicrobiales bacterium]|nr:arylsulfatase [Verrucomicrobiales bacterium]
MRFTRSLRVAGLLVLLVLGLEGWAAESRASTGVRRPNFLVILADDLGFSDLGCYGGEIHTPNLDRLARRGLRFTQFYNTARCWPTRSALLTGYYPQQIGMDPPTQRLPAWTRLLPHYLRPFGYRSYHVGKWHIPGAPRSVADGGFDRSYRLEDHDRNFHPTRRIENDRALPAIPPGTDFYTSTDFADVAIRYLGDHAREHADQPFFLYLAFTVPHFPLQAPSRDVARYRHRYRIGWDNIREQRWRRLTREGLVACELGPREESVVPYWNLETSNLLRQLGAGEVGHAVAWNLLNEEQRQFQATKMAIHAAMVDRMDREIGRVLDQVRAMGEWEDTVILFMSDNGASAEQIVRGDGHEARAVPGSAGSYLCLGPGWSMASNTPFRRHKSWVHEGGVATPLILHWPRGIGRRGGLRSNVGHVIDLVPTLHELASGGPGSPPMDSRAPAFPGRSLVPTLAQDGAVERDFLYFHHDGNRALRVGDWKLVSGRPETNAWCLYHLGTDRSETRDVAAEHPARVSEMTSRWEALEAVYRRQAVEGAVGQQ